MLEIKELSDIRGNNVVLYSIRTLLEKGTYPKFTIMAGNMGVGKSTAANLVAAQLDETGVPVQVLNFGNEVKMQDVEDTVFKMNPSRPKVFIFEEMQGLDKSQQTALLTMLDKRPDNVYLIGTTTEEYKILRTIRSRATVWHFRLLGEKQLGQLLDDYLEGQGASMTVEAKTVLLKACHGVPRDLLKSADLAISGDFSSNQLSELLGRVSDDLVYTILCSLKSVSVDFAVNMTTLLDDNSKDKLVHMRDFYTRYLLERKGIDGATISKERLSQLDSLFTDEDRNKIGRTLIRATADTLTLELAMLNMELTRTGTSQLVGQQIDRVATQQSVAASKDTTSDLAGRRLKANLTASDLSSMKLE